MLQLLTMWLWNPVTERKLSVGSTDKMWIPAVFVNIHFTGQLYFSAEATDKKKYFVEMISFWNAQQKKAEAQHPDKNTDPTFETCYSFLALKSKWRSGGFFAPHSVIFFEST